MQPSGTWVCSIIHDTSLLVSVSSVDKSDTHQAPGYVLSYIHVITSLLVSVVGKSDTQTCEGSTPLKIFFRRQKKQHIHIDTQ